MTTALREEVSRVSLFAHMLVIGRKRLGEEIARELPFLLADCCARRHFALIPQSC